MLCIYDTSGNERERNINKMKDVNAQIHAQKMEQRFVNRFNEMYGHAFEYIEGYNTCKNNKIIIKCKVCGIVRSRARRKIFEKENIACVCGNNRKGTAIYNCRECGKEFVQYSPQQILCKDCHNILERTRRNIHSRLREAKAKENGKVDYSITLARLMKRDNHTCKLCGRKVNESDYTYINDTFIAGNDYPSIDHIKPLSKGGVHQWDNVQLAHRICNSLKSDK